MKRRYHYYVVEVPTEAYDDDKSRCEAAIDQARENARLYCIPAEWRAHKISESFEYTKCRVVRITNAPRP